MISRCASDYSRLQQDVDTFDDVISAELSGEYVELGLFASVIDEEIVTLESHRPHALSDDLRQQVQVLEQANANFARRAAGNVRARSRSASPRSQKCQRHIHGRKAPRRGFAPNPRVDRLLVRRYVRRHLARLRDVIADREVKTHKEERIWLQKEKREIERAQHHAVAVVEGAKEKIRSERESCEMEMRQWYADKAAEQMKILEAEVARHTRFQEVTKLEIRNRVAEWTGRCQNSKKLRASFDSWRRGATAKHYTQLRHASVKLHRNMERRSEVLQTLLEDRHATCIMRRSFASLVRYTQYMRNQHFTTRWNSLVSANCTLEEQVQACRQHLQREGRSRRASISKLDALQIMHTQRHAFTVWQVALLGAKNDYLVFSRHEFVLAHLRKMLHRAASASPAHAFLVWKYHTDCAKHAAATSDLQERNDSTEKNLQEQLRSSEEQWKKQVSATEEQWRNQLRTTEDHWEKQLCATDTQWKNQVSAAEEEWKKRMAAREQHWQEQIAMQERQWKENQSFAENQWKERLSITEEQWQTQLTSKEEQLMAQLATAEQNMRTTTAHLTDQLRNSNQHLAKSEEHKALLTLSHNNARDRFLASMRSVTFHQVLNAWRTLSARSAHIRRLDHTATQTHACLGMQLTAGWHVLAFRAWKDLFLRNRECMRRMGRRLNKDLLHSVLRGLRELTEAQKADRKREKHHEKHMLAWMKKMLWIGVGDVVTAWHTVARRQKLVHREKTKFVGRKDHRLLLNAFKHWLISNAASKAEFTALRSRLAKNTSARIIASNAAREVRILMLVAFVSWKNSILDIRQARHSEQLTEARLTQRRRTLALVALQCDAQMSEFVGAWRWAAVDAKRQRRAEEALQRQLSQEKSAKEASLRAMLSRMMQQNEARDSFLVHNVFTEWRHIRLHSKNRDRRTQANAAWATQKVFLLTAGNTRLVLTQWRNIVQHIKVERCSEHKMRDAVATMEAKIQLHKTLSCARQWARLAEMLDALEHHKESRREYGASYHALNKRLKAQCTQSVLALEGFVSSTDEANARMFSLSKVFRQWHMLVTHLTKEQSTEHIRQARKEADLLKAQMDTSIRKWKVACAFSSDEAVKAFFRSCFLAWGSLAANQKKQNLVEQSYKNELDQSNEEAGKAIKLLQEHMQKYFSGFMEKHGARKEVETLIHAFDIWKTDVESTRYKRKVETEIEEQKESNRKSERMMLDMMQEHRVSMNLRTKKMMWAFVDGKDKDLLFKVMVGWKQVGKRYTAANRWIAAYVRSARTTTLQNAFAAWTQEHLEHRVCELRAKFKRSTRKNQFASNIAVCFAKKNDDLTLAIVFKAWKTILADTERRRKSGRTGRNFAFAVMKMFKAKAFEAWADITRKIGHEKIRCFEILQYMVGFDLGLFKKYFSAWVEGVKQSQIMAAIDDQTNRYLANVSSRFSSVWSFTDSLAVSLAFRTWRFSAADATELGQCELLARATHRRRMKMVGKLWVMFARRNTQRRNKGVILEILNQWRQITTQLSLERANMRLRTLEELIRRPKTSNLCQTSVSFSSGDNTYSMPEQAALECFIESDQDRIGRFKPDIAPHNRLFRDRDNRSISPRLFRDRENRSISPQRPSPRAAYTAYRHGSASQAHPATSSTALAPSFGDRLRLFGPRPGLLSPSKPAASLSITSPRHRASKGDLLPYHTSIPGTSERLRERSWDRTGRQFDRSSSHGQRSKTDGQVRDTSLPSRGTMERRDTSAQRIRNLEAQVRILKGQCDCVEEDIHATVTEVRSHVQRNALTGAGRKDCDGQNWILHQVNRLESSLSPLRRTRQRLDAMNNAED